MTDTANNFRQAIEKAGLTLPDTIPLGGKVRVPGVGKGNGNKSGWAFLFEDGRGGAFGDWASDLSETWHAGHDHAMTAAERAAHTLRVAKLQRIRQEEEATQYVEAAARAREIWDHAAPAPADHAYLTNKQVKPHGLRVDGEGRLIVPVSIDGSLASLQTIDESGGKLFLPGGKVQGGSYTTGDLTETTTILICEGFATGATLHEACGLPVVVAFNAGNLKPVALALREQYPGLSLILCADDDVETKGNPGLTKATEAAGAADGRLIVPDFDANRPAHVTDFNDLANLHGLDAVREAITTAMENEAAAGPEAAGLSSAIVSFQDLLMLKIAERPRYLPWLPKGSTVMVYGPRGVGKTFFQLGLAVSLAAGKPFLKWDCSEAVGVLYVDGEMQLDELRQRTTTLMNSPPVAPLEFLSSQLVFERCKKDLVLTSEAMRDEVSKILKARQDIGVLILDNASCLFSGLDENSKRDWEPLNAWLIRLRHRGIATVLVHHAGKTGAQRGTSGREDSLDTLIQLTKPTDGDAREGCHFQVSFTKCRSVTGEAVADLDVKLSTVNGRMGWVWNPLEMSLLERARQQVNEGIAGPSDLAEALGCTKGYASKLLNFNSR